MLAAEVAFDKRIAVTDDSTNDDLVRRAAKAGSKKAVEALANDVEPPLELSHIMLWHTELRNRAQRGMHFEPVQFSEIESYFRLHPSIRWDEFDVDMIVKIDDLWQVKQPPPKGT